MTTEINKRRIARISTHDKVCIVDKFHDTELVDSKMVETNEQAEAIKHEWEEFGCRRKFAPTFIPLEQPKDRN